MGRTTNYKIKIEDDLTGASFIFFCVDKDKPFDGEEFGFAIEESNFESLIMPFVGGVDWYGENHYTYERINKVLIEIEKELEKARFGYISKVCVGGTLCNSDGEYFSMCDYDAEKEAEEIEKIQECIYDFYEEFIERTRIMMEEHPNTNDFCIDGY